MELTATNSLKAQQALIESQLQEFEKEREAKSQQILDRWAPMFKNQTFRTQQEIAARNASAQIYENQHNHLYRELTEETRAINVGPFQKYIYPVLRRVVPNMIAHELVSVQAINSPVAAIFYLDFLYGSNKGGTVAGNAFPQNFDRDYSSEFQNGEPIGTGDGVNFGVPGASTALAINLAYYPVRPLDAGRGWSVVIQEINPTTGAIVQTVTDNGVGGFTSVPAGAVGTINYSNGAISGFKFANIPGIGNSLKAFYYYDSELSSKVAQVQLDIKKAQADVVTRKLKAIWSIESMEDLKALHGTDAEAEMVAQTSASILLEVDREILNDLLQASFQSQITATFDRLAPAAIAEIDHLRSLITKMSDVSNTIHQRTFRAPANWAVCSTATASLVEQLTTHHDYRPIWVSGDPQSSPMDMPRPMLQHGQFGIYKMGTLQNKWVIYVDPFAPRDFILMGLKGSNFLDSGYVYSPYVTLQVTNSLYDPDNFGMRKGFRMRYAKKTTRPDFYGNVRVINL